MTAYCVKLVDAFTSHCFEGNPAGVVLDARGLRDETMQAVAREMNASETAFILPPTRKDADVRIRWFTPAEEVPLCGHATIAGFHALAEEGLHGMRTNGQHYFRLETKSGILPVKVEKNFNGIGIEFDLPIPVFKKKSAVPAPLIHALGLKAADLGSNLPAVQEAYIYFPVKRLTILRRMQPRFTELAAVCRKLRVTGVCVFTFDTIEASSAVHSRFFAPSVGINEDPVTGSANGPLGLYIDSFVPQEGKRIPMRELPDGRREYIGEQGDVIGRRGRVKIRLLRQDGLVERLSIAGEAVTVCSATMNL